jgi:hypothetical protein
LPFRAPSTACGGKTRRIVVSSTVSADGLGQTVLALRRFGREAALDKGSDDYRRMSDFQKVEIYFSSASDAQRRLPPQRTGAPYRVARRHVRAQHERRR